MSKTTEQRIEEIIDWVMIETRLDEPDSLVFRLKLEGLVLSAKLDQLKESK